MCALAAKSPTTPSSVPWSVKENWTEQLMSSMSLKAVTPDLITYWRDVEKQATNPFFFERSRLHRDHLARRKNPDGAVAVFREMKQALPDLVTQCRVVAVIEPLIWRRADVNWWLEIWHTFVSVGCSVKGHTRRSLGQLLVGFHNFLGAIQGNVFCRTSLLDLERRHQDI